MLSITVGSDTFSGAVGVTGTLVESGLIDHISDSLFFTLNFALGACGGSGTDYRKI